MRGVWPERNDRDVEAIKCVWECGGKKRFFSGETDEDDWYCLVCWISRFVQMDNNKCLKFESQVGHGVHG